MERIPKPGEVYRHFEGELYRIVTLAEHTESGERLVVYQSLYGDFSVFARPLAQFVGEVDHLKYPQVKEEYRFTLVPEAGQLCTERAAGTESELEKPVVDSVEISTQACAEESGDLLPIDSELMAFLDADSYEKKLEIFSGLQERADEGMLRTMAISLDLELDEGSVADQYEALKNCLLTLEHYECNRLR